VQRASTKGSVAIGRNRSGRASGWSVSRLSGTGSGPHHATVVSRSSAVGSSSVSQSNATAHDAATDCGVGPARVVVQHVGGPLGQQPQVRVHGYAGVREQRSGLLDRQQQITDRLGHPVRISRREFGCEAVQ
jgi:hypothetical protein